MDRRLFRLYLIELVATFGLVFFSAGAVCVNHLTTPTDQQPATATQTPYQPGLVGIATNHVDAFGNRHEPDEETLSRLIAALGLPSDPEHAAAALDAERYLRDTPGPDPEAHWGKQTGEIIEAVEAS